MADTSIEWTDAVWNPVTGCSKVSQGCKNCYAEGIADRFFAKQYPPNADGSLRKFTDVRCHEDRLEQPLHWKKPSMIFVNSMSDLFHEDVPDLFLCSIFDVMCRSKRHTFQILTKRPERMTSFLSNWPAMTRDFGPLWPNMWPQKHIWLGVSVEDQKTADERIPLLLQTPAAVRWVSYEPALGPVDFGRLVWFKEGFSDPDFQEKSMGRRRLNWLVCGGESGPGARPCNLEWLRSVVAQCKAAGVPCFVKQLGSNPYFCEREMVNPRDGYDRTLGLHLRDRKGGDITEFPGDLRIREYPAAGR